MYHHLEIVRRFKEDIKKTEDIRKITLLRMAIKNIKKDQQLAITMYNAYKKCEFTELIKSTIKTAPIIQQKIVNYSIIIYRGIDAIKKCFETAVSQILTTETIDNMIWDTINAIRGSKYEIKFMKDIKTYINICKSKCLYSTILLIHSYQVGKGCILPCRVKNSMFNLNTFNNIKNYFIRHIPITRFGKPIYLTSIIKEYAMVFIKYYMSKDHLVTHDFVEIMSTLGSKDCRDIIFKLPSYHLRELAKAIVKKPTFYERILEDIIVRYVTTWKVYNISILIELAIKYKYKYKESPRNIANKIKYVNTSPTKASVILRNINKHPYGAILLKVHLGICVSTIAEKVLNSLTHNMQRVVGRHEFRNFRYILYQVGMKGLLSYIPVFVKQIKNHYSHKYRSIASLLIKRISHEASYLNAKNALELLIDNRLNDLIAEADILNGEVRYGSNFNLCRRKRIYKTKNYIKASELYPVITIINSYMYE